MSIYVTFCILDCYVYKSEWLWFKPSTNQNAASVRGGLCGRLFKGLHRSRGCTKGHTEGCIEGCAEGYTYDCADGCAEGFTEACMESRVEIFLEGCTDGCVVDCTEECIEDSVQSCAER